MRVGIVPMRAQRCAYRKCSDVVVLSLAYRLDSGVKCRQQKIARQIFNSKNLAIQLPCLNENAYKWNVQSAFEDSSYGLLEVVTL